MNTKEDFEIETERLKLRKFRDCYQDASFLHQLLSNPKVFKFLDVKPSQSVAESASRIRERILLEYSSYGYGRLLVFHKETEALIGFSGLKYIDQYHLPEVGFCFLPSSWGKGFATESALASIN
ncbi:MAG: GNAT family N-acetyltransferase [Oligoflexales bacterium]|nr:GNAT family N-acetyltransferase [Oligoflexales bacterium]